MADYNAAQSRIKELEAEIQQLREEIDYLKASSPAFVGETR